MAVKRVFVEKMAGYDIEARHVLADIRTNLGLASLEGLRLINRYDVEGISNKEYDAARKTIFSEPNVDIVYDEVLDIGSDEHVFAVEYLPGQYDQRADSAAQCISLLTQKEPPVVRCAKLYLLKGNLSQKELNLIKKYTINPVEAREALLDKPRTLELKLQIPSTVETLSDFIKMSEEELEKYHGDMGFAMTVSDLLFVQKYFLEQEGRAPTITELKVIDTYWSDHCRHTTFLTRIENITIEDGPSTRPIKEAYRLYRKTREGIYAGRAPKDICLMDMATIAMKEIKKRGGLQDLDESEEINACSIVIQADIDGHEEEWLVMFKNETHNHPTEIEPFGGAATCLGGAIRDPLSGRSYVYQAMRVTGSGDPRATVHQTLVNKLPQRKITTGAAAGYSSYGNQIGLATGQVSEIYDEGYIAKRLEIGAVVGAAPRENVRRDVPEKGDIVILLGGRTGRDGCGGATGSSKAHTEESLHTCGAEVQKGNAPTERKLQRLFRNKDFSLLVKRCNDFGAGGVCVAIGELAPGLDINLDAVPKKYEGLDGTELAISESQERMAVVIHPKDMTRLLELAQTENLEATPVAVITDTDRLRMLWKGNIIVNISRAFLDTNGVTQTADAHITAPDAHKNYFASLLPATEKYLDTDLKQAFLENLKNLNVCSQKGLSERFDSTIGKGTVLMPFGGKYQLTPAPAMAAKLPLTVGQTDTATMMSWGFDPALSRISPFHGAVYAVVESLCKLACIGGDIEKARLTQQEYFERLRQEPSRWGKPAAALLGSLLAQLELNIPAIGGKDSMSGSYMKLDVPPTLVCFALTWGSASKVISPEFKAPGMLLAHIPLPMKEDMMPDFAKLKKNYKKLYQLIQEGKITTAAPVSAGGIAAAIAKMSFGNGIGAQLIGLDKRDYFTPAIGSVIVTCTDYALLESLDYKPIGMTQAAPVIECNGVEIPLEEAQAAWTMPLDKIFPATAAAPGEAHDASYTSGRTSFSRVCTAKPKVFIPVFPGTNCEYDTVRAFTEAGAQCNVLVLKNQTPADIEESILAISQCISKSNIIMLPGGFSGGDEPDGSGKFIATTFRSPRIKDSVMELLKNRDGLMLGICNGFQALIKLGLVPYGEIRELDNSCPTLTFNTIGRHVSCMSNIRIASNRSPWLSLANVGETYVNAMSHGEGRFVATPIMLRELESSGQIATQYADLSGHATMESPWNPNGSMMAIEGIISPDGRILGKMGHVERGGNQIAKNVPGNYNLQIFKAGVLYYR